MDLVVFLVFCVPMVLVIDIMCDGFEMYGFVLVDYIIA